MIKGDFDMQSNNMSAMVGGLAGGDSGTDMFVDHDIGDGSPRGTVMGGFGR